MKGCMNMNGEEIKDTLKKYNLQSWSKQRNTNPIPVEKGEGLDGEEYQTIDKREQERVVEIVALPGIQSQPLPQTGAYPATADAVPPWLTPQSCPGHG